jgi:hypothetical protein
MQGPSRQVYRSAERKTVMLDKVLQLKGIRGIVYRLGQLELRVAHTLNVTHDFARLVKRRSGKRPSIAAVIVGRNDDYMSDFKERLRVTVEWNIRYLVDEVVFVEWNPPADRELLSIGLSKSFSCLRAFVVSPEIHRAICRNTQLPLLEFHAKNVGIRRARSDWIVATNADTAFGPDTVRRLLRAGLSDDIVWSAQRIDIPWREGRKTGLKLSDCIRYRRIIPYHPLGTGEFALASKRLWESAGGYDESLVRHRIGVDKRGVAQMVARGASSSRVGLVFHMTHTTSCTEAVQTHHGEFATLEGIPYQNNENWGLADRTEKQISERVWLLE